MKPDMLAVEVVATWDVELVLEVELRDDAVDGMVVEDEKRVSAVVDKMSEVENVVLPLVLEMDSDKVLGLLVLVPVESCEVAASEGLSVVEPITSILDVVLSSNVCGAVRAGSVCLVASTPSAHACDVTASTVTR